MQYFEEENLLSFDYNVYNQDSEPYLFCFNSPSNNLDYINNYDSIYFSSDNFIKDNSKLEEENIYDFEDNIKKNENDSKKSNLNKTKSTAENSEKAKNQKEKKIFNIKKQKKNLGRKPKNAIDKENSKHKKDSNDNIRAKMKRYLFSNIFNFSNILLNYSKNPNLKKLRFKKINTSIINKCKIDDVKNLLNLKVKDILSEELSNHHTKTIKNFNKNIIDLILKNSEQEKELIQALNKTFKEMLYIYISDINDNSEDNILFKDFRRLKDDLKFFQENGEEQSFIDKYEMTAKNFESIINKIEPRKSRKQ